MMYQVYLDELIPKENFYRKLNAEFDLQFLYKETEKHYSSEGQESVDPVVFFKNLFGWLSEQHEFRQKADRILRQLFRHTFDFAIGY